MNPVRHLDVLLSHQVVLWVVDALVQQDKDNVLRSGYRQVRWVSECVVCGCSCMDVRAGMGDVGGDQ